MDVLDEAERKERRLREAAIKRAQGALAGEGSDSCACCGEPINPERRAAHPQARRCLGCQQVFEKRGT